MTLLEVVEKLNLKVFSGSKGLTKKVNGGYVSDLLSNVMGNANEGELWITLQSHKNVIAIASLKDLAGIILVDGIEPETDSLKISNEEGIPFLGTVDSCFEITGKLYNLLADNK